MKKLLAFVTASLLALSLVACGGGGKKADGVYTARTDAAFAESNHNWTDELVITYKDGAVVDAVFESYDPDGNKKSEATAESYPMTPAPAEWIPQLSENVKAAGSADKVEAVAGATHASDSAKKLFEAIEKEGKAGETLTVTMPVEAAE